MDPFSDHWGNKARIFDDVYALLDAAKNCEGCLLVVDESCLSLDRHDPSQFWLAKASRHNHHSSFFIGQNYVDIPKGMRTNCTQVIIFRSTRTDAKALANEFDDDRLLQITHLEDGQFFRVVKGKVSRGYVDFSKQKIFLAALDKDTKKE